MADKMGLKGLTVLVTMPEHQAQSLCELLEDYDAEVIVFPVIEIIGIEPQKWPDFSLSQFDMLVFVSRNAVDFFVAGLKREIPNSVQIISVGDATAKALKNNWIKVDISPPSPAGSESLLSMPEMKDVADKKVLIVRGESGRELLAETLIARGASISYLEVYQRRLAKPSGRAIAQAKMADCIVITSVAGIDNLCQILDDEKIKAKPFIVISDRIKQHAIGLGFQSIYVTDDVKDAAVVQQVIEVGRNNGK